MKKNTFLIALGLIALSALLHAVHIMIFHEPHHLFLFLMGDIAFIPLEVFFVTLVLDRLIERREQTHKMKKTNMLIGLFYQELGNKVLDQLVAVDNSFDRKAAKVDFKWEADQYATLSGIIKKHNHKIEIGQLDLPSLNETLKTKQDLIVSLLTNPSVGEHEVFSDSLMSLFHLQEELMQRSLDDLNDFDRDHLQVDIKRAYRSLSLGWVDYLAHIQQAYPYLFLSAISNNPFDKRDREIVEREVVRTRS